jgi:hypothetical protein
MPPSDTDEGLRGTLEPRREYPGLAVLLFSQYIETDGGPAGRPRRLPFARLGGEVRDEGLRELRLPPSEKDNRRVLAVLRYLDS